MSGEALDALRVAFIGLLGAERRLRGREGQQAEQLSLAHYRMLSCLLDHGRLASGRLAAAADLSPASATQMLDLLEKRGMVVRERDPLDRRVVVAAPTAEGRRLTAQRRAEFRALWGEVLGDLDEAELAVGVDVLERVARASSNCWPSARPRRSRPRTEPSLCWLTSLGLKPAARRFDTGAMATALRSDAPRALLPLSLDDYAPAPINAPDVIDGNPVARAHHVVEGPGAWDAGFWDCTAGRFRWYYGDPELVHVLEGEVLVTDGAGVRHHLRPGDIFLFPRRTTWEWEVPDYVRKAFVMHPSPTDRARRRIRGLRRRVARLSNAASAQSRASHGALTALVSQRPAGCAPCSTGSAPSRTPGNA